ncbi:hypothetical protein Tco_1107701 [Tanacetum coccineum]
MPSSPSPEPTISYFNDLDYLKDFKNEFPAIVYNDALTSKLDFLNEPSINLQHIDEFNLKDETSLFECDGEEQNVLYFNDLFPFNVIYPNDLKSDDDNDDKKIDTEQPSWDTFVIPLFDEINTDFGAYAQGSNKLLKTSHNTSNMDLLPRYQKHQYLRFEGLEYTDAYGKGHRDAQEQSVFTSRAWRRLFEVRGPLFGEARRCMSWREFILGMCLHTSEEMESTGFGAYWAKSARKIPDKGDLSAYWRGIPSEGDFFGTSPYYTMIRYPMLRLCHRLIACSIAGRSQAPEKVTMTALFYLRGMEVDSINIPYLLARYLRRFASRRKRGALISRGQFVARLAEHFGLLTEERL